MSIDIYKEVILDHYKNPRNFGTLPHASHQAQVANPLCGDNIIMDLEVKEGAIKDIRFNGEGCAIAVASASLLTEYAKHRATKDLQNLDASFMLNLLSVELSANRLKCALVSLEALQKAIQNYESESQGSQ